MINSKNILTLGTDWRTTKGGIAQVIGTYSKIYEPFHFIPTTKGSNFITKLYTFFEAYLKTVYYFTFRDIQVVHIHSACYTSFFRKRYFINLACFFNKKVIIHIHGAEFELFYNTYPERVKKILSKVDMVVALSQSWKDFFERRIGLQNVSIIKNIIEEPRPMSDCNISEKCHLLFLGYIGKRKGIYDLIDSIVENRQILGDKIVLHIGGNGEIEKLQQIISDNKLDEIVKYEGWTSGSRKYELLCMADVYILPSYNEGLPISILEAMSYELPIISTPVGGIPEIVEDNVNGILVAPGNKEQLANAMIELCNDIPKRERMGKESFLKVHDHLPGNVEKQLNNLYKELQQNGFNNTMR